MKTHLIILLAVAAAVAGCSRPREIPDDKLQAIFSDIFLVNAYTNTHHMLLDSMDIYSPVLERYGYKPRDLAYTIRHFSTRKSSRLSDIIDRSVEALTKEYDYYAYRVGVLDTIDNIARRRFADTVYRDTLIRVTSLRDTSRLRIRIPAREGQYTIWYAYTIDSLDRGGQRANHTVTDSTGRQLAARTNWMRRDRRGTFSATLDAPAEASGLDLLLGDYRGENKSPRLRIDSLVVVYYLPLKQALDSLTRSIVDYKLLIDGKEYSRAAAPDSVALRIDPPRMGAGRDTLR